MDSGLTRRRFVSRSLVIGGALACPLIMSRCPGPGALGRLNVAGIGVGGKGADDIAKVGSENIVALCDVDEDRAAETFARHPAAKRYRDFRVMLEREGRRIDAVVVSTPDHMHAHVAILAMRLGKHVFCQKPLAHTVEEARKMAEIARMHKVVTQMGIQGLSNLETRRFVELIRAGVLGKVREVHCWTDRPGAWWVQGVDRPKGISSPPSTLDWDLWVGAAPWRPFNPAYLPFKWRGFWDFGTGALGDMGCHLMNLTFFALGLKYPKSVEAQSSGLNSESGPVWSTIHYEFRQADSQTDIGITWYDGGNTPPGELFSDGVPSRSGMLIIGDKDTLYVPESWGSGSFKSGARVEDFAHVPQSLPRTAEFDKNHYTEWIAACKGGPVPLANFDYSGPLTESILLGNVALRLQTRVECDPHTASITNVPHADHLLRKEYRPGWIL